jgi:hypothetical protein
MAQRFDVLIELPGNGSYPIIAQVEGKPAPTGIVLAVSGAPVSRLAAEAGENAPPVDLSLERRLEAATPMCTENLSSGVAVMKSAKDGA